MTEIKCYCGHTINCDCVPLKKQTAVEYLVSKIASKIDNEYWSNQQDITEYVEQAKAMEKEQIIDTYWASYNEGKYRGDKTADEYYKEIFKQE
jgi:hypothetical protein